MLVDFDFRSSIFEGVGKRGRDFRDFEGVGQGGAEFRGCGEEG